MSLVQGLEEKQARDKEIYMTNLADFLHSAEVNASFSREPVLDHYEAVKEREPVIKIAWQLITRIMLHSRLFTSCRLWQSISFFDYEVPLRHIPSTRLTGKLKVRVKPVIQGRTPLLF